ncbi:MAG TPA: hypothetical protein VFO55_11730, partial [Gemmatimonadaceae bacterium]|nr:hypothetical protein [Gemmatimonadaceae bacterium]
MRGWDELEATVHARVSDVLVVDPMVDGTARADVILEIHRQFPSLPIVVYTALSAASTRAIVQVGRAG